jgi:hypothetical protein
MQRTLTVMSIWLSLAAAPTFALMAIATIALGDTSMCMPAALPPLNPMAQMYLLMAFFHASPWLKVVR